MHPKIISFRVGYKDLIPAYSLTISTGLQRSFHLLNAYKLLSHATFLIIDLRLAGRTFHGRHLVLPWYQ